MSLLGLRRTEVFSWPSSRAKFTAFGPVVLVIFLKKILFLLKMKMVISLPVDVSIYPTLIALTLMHATAKGEDIPAFLISLYIIKIGLSQVARWNKMHCTLKKAFSDALKGGASKTFLGASARLPLSGPCMFRQIDTENKTAELRLFVSRFLDHQASMLRMVTSVQIC